MTVRDELYERIIEAADLLPDVAFLQVIKKIPASAMNTATRNAAAAVLESYRERLITAQGPITPEKKKRAKATPTAPANNGNGWRTERRMPEPPLKHEGLDRTGGSYPRRILASLCWIIQHGRDNGFSDMETAEEIMLEIQRGHWIE